MVKSKFLSSGVYGCVYYPAYTCQGTEPPKKTTTVSKIVKHEFTTKTETGDNLKGFDFGIKPLTGLCLGMFF